MTVNFEVRPLSLEEMATPLSWAKAEAWNPGLSDAEPFWRTDPNGFLGGFLNGEPVAVISAVRYEGLSDEHQRGSFGFIGFYIVHPDHRGKPYAVKIARAAMAHFGGVGSIGIDGVLERQENYQAFGFIYAHRNGRYKGHLPLQVSAPDLDKNESISQATQIDFEALCQFDAEHFPTNRRKFLELWINQQDHRCLAIRGVKQNEILGYGVIRPCFDGYKIGPLFARQKKYADSLVHALCKGLPDQSSFYIDVPTDNQEALQLTRQFGMEMVFETGRMYRGSVPELPIDEIFGITTFELG
jgi:hypothetical protein